MKSISIIGLGWLGEALAKEFTLNGFLVKGTKTTKTVSNNNIQIFEWRLGEAFPKEAASSIYIICISDNSAKIAQYEKLFNEIIQFGAKKIIFISTTSVYKNLENELTEDSEILIDENNQTHLSICSLLSIQFKDSIILRLSGLVGPKRHPAKFLSGKKNVLNPSQRVNLVHQYDVIKFIEHCIDKEVRGIYNVCSSAHPTRKEFYTKVCEVLNLEPPEFSEDKEKERWVSNEKSKTELGFQYKYDDLLEYYLSSDSKE